MNTKIITGDILKVAGKLDTVDCVVTSPPYYMQRDYGHVDQLGREGTLKEYVDNLVNVFSLIREKMPDTGTLFLNLGDKYLNGRLAGAPWRVALALVDDGWVLKNDVIWHRNRIMPESAKNRFTKCHEYVFLLTKQVRGYTFNGDDVREVAKWAHDRRAGKGRHVYKETRGDKSHTAAVYIAADGKRKRRSVWTIETSQTKVGNHNATFPEELAEICIRAGSNEGDTVLDPFVGTGTCGVVASRLNRNFVGVDISSEFTGMSRKRIRDAQYIKQPAFSDSHSRG